MHGPIAAVASRRLLGARRWRSERPPGNGNGDAEEGSGKPPPPFGVPPSEEGRSGDLGPPPPVFRDVGGPGPGEPPPPYEIRPAGAGAARRKLWPRLVVGLVILLIVFVIANILVGLYVDRLWFDELGYRGVFNTRIGTRVWLFFAALALAVIFLLGNLIAAWRLPLETQGAESSPLREVPLASVKRAGLIGGAVVALFIAIAFAAAASGEWETILQFMHAESFGVSDPQFNRDAGFYTFKLEALQFIKGWALGLAIVGLFAAIAVYGFRWLLHGGNVVATRSTRIHAALLLTAIIGLLVWGYWLGRLELVLSDGGTVFGATFTDVNVRDTAYLVMMAAGAVVAVTVLSFPFHERLLVPGAGLGFLVAASLGGLVIYPAIVQRFTVEPNELNREREFISRNIEATRLAFGLNGVAETSFPAEDRITPADLEADSASLRNVRVWDHRPLIDTLGTIQQLRELYNFPDVDVDRYVVDGESRQVFLGARELSHNQLPADQQGWVNRRLQFTHGFGVTVSPVDVVTTSGEPSFFVSNIPPEISNVADLASAPFEIAQPRIYFGEDTDEWVIVNSDSEEFDFPSVADPSAEEGVLNLESQARNRYDGIGGIQLGGFFKRLAFAWEFQDTNILISGSVNGDSRLLLRRNVQDRVAELAPFLRLDADPYIVIGRDGGLFWIQDAYTSTDRFPYAEPHSSGVNYIRNSVKVVVDAFNGTVDFYIVDDTDPIIRVWQKIFPDLFRPEADFPADLREHWRYPQDLFQIQSDQYLTYHVVDATELFNRSDTWDIPLETLVSDQQVPLEPYYVNISLPGSGEPEFLLILPFTPRGRPNAIAWLAGRSDGPNYGELFAFRFPVDKNVNGPQQIEAIIGNDSEVRTQINLLEDEGSGVIRGNLLFIPVGDSYLYVEPIFVQSRNSAFPQLQFVIAVNGDTVGFASGLEEAATEALGFPANTGTAIVGEPGGGDDTGVPRAAPAAPADVTGGEEEPPPEAPPPETLALEEPAADRATDIRSLLDQVEGALSDSRDQVDLLERLRDALQALAEE